MSSSVPVVVLHRRSRIRRPQGFYFSEPIYKLDALNFKRLVLTFPPILVQSLSKSQEMAASFWNPRWQMSPSWSMSRHHLCYQKCVLLSRLNIPTKFSWKLAAWLKNDNDFLKFIMAAVVIFDFVSSSLPCQDCDLDQVPKIEIIFVEVRWTGK